MRWLFAGMLIFVPITIIAHVLDISQTIIFFLATCAIIPLAKYIGEATEELATRTGPAWGSLLNATFGNATELIIAIIALRAGLIDIVKASITGSVIGNLLLVLGLAIVAGGWKREKQTFNKTAITTSASTLFLAVVALVIPAIFVTTSHASTASIEQLSIFVAVILLCVYVASLVFSLHTHKHLYIEDIGTLESRWGIGRSVATLLVATIMVAWMSDILVGAIEPLISHFGWSALFVGVIFIAIIGNAAENASAITAAVKNRMDLSLQIAIGSATQIIMLVAPILVFISIVFNHPLNLSFPILELVAIVVSVLIVNLVVMDGETNWLEGAQLLVTYSIIAAAFYLFV